LVGLTPLSIISVSFIGAGTVLPGENNSTNFNKMNIHSLSTKRRTPHMTLKIYNLSSALGQAQAYGGFKSM
jgi:hypothetical protein